VRRRAFASRGRSSPPAFGLRRFFRYALLSAALPGCLFASGVLAPLECGDGLLSRALGEECDDGNAEAGDGCSPACLIEAPASCGDGDLEPGEECDDENAASNDGCSSACALEAEVFVECGGGGGAGAPGSLANPFTALSDALAAAPAGARVMILPRSPFPCEAAQLEDSVMLIGVADPDAPDLPARPVIDGLDKPAVDVRLDDLAITLRGLALRSSNDGPVFNLRRDSAVSLIDVDIQNSRGASGGGSGANVAGVLCEPSGLRAFLIDRARIHDTRGAGFRGAGDCRAVIANTLFVGDEIGVELSGAGVAVAVVHSTFDQNGAAMDCADAAGRLDSSVVSGANGATPLAGACEVSFSDVVGAGLGGDNLDADPRLAADGSLLPGSPCLGAANPAPAALPFTPAVDVFGHDLLGAPRPRPAGAPADMGAFESD
jgi:cysteine-rich repeat protein